jgi:hypothetical protein
MAPRAWSTGGGRRLPGIAPDEWFARWATGGGFDSVALSRMMGGQATLRSYGVEGRGTGEIERQRHRVPAAHRDWLGGLPIALDLEVCGRRYWVVHAGIPSTMDLPGVGVEGVVPYLAAHHPSCAGSSCRRPP